MRSIKLTTALALALTAVSGSALLAQEAFTPVTDEMLANPNPEDWIHWRGNQQHWGYSQLDQITTDNVDNLTLAWSRSLSSGDMEGTPLVYNGVLYMPQAKSVITAYDATNGDVIWEYRRRLPDDLSENVQLDSVVRSIGIYDDKIIHLTADGYILALNAVTGALEWETEVSNYQTHTTWQTSGPMIVNGRAISGRSCEPSGGPEACFLAAHDLETGEELWRTFTIPRPGEPGDETWGNIPYEARWHVGSWMTPSVDPELGLAYFGTSVTSPYSKFILGSEDQDAEHLYQTSTLALDIETGEIRWYLQHIRDQWDLDHPFERILLDTTIAPNPDEVPWINPSVTAGEERQVLTGIPGKPGIFYSIDRATGEFLWARETSYQNAVLDIDPTNGRATMNSDLFFTEADQTHLVCPSAIGGKDWQTGAYSPLTNVIYYPLHNLCMEATSEGDRPVVEELGQVDLGTIPRPGVENLGTVRGISVETGEETWLNEQREVHMSLLTTAGGLLFGGDMNRRFRAYDQTTGEQLWETILGGSVGGYPVSYSVDGRQYVAVATGPFLVSGMYDMMTPEASVHNRGANLYVFALPEG